LNDELTSLNEELTSLNDELTSLNDELTSLNDHLTSLNDELTSLNDHLTFFNSDLRDLNDRLTLLNDDLRDTNERLTLLNKRMSYDINDSKSRRSGHIKPFGGLLYRDVVMNIVHRFFGVGSNKIGRFIVFLGERVAISPFELIE